MKEVVLYKFHKEVPTITDEMLGEYIFKECGTLQQATIGFKPNGFGELIDQVDEFTKVLRVSTQTKKPKSSEVNRRLKARVKEYFEQFGTYPNKQQKDEFKQEIFENLLSVTFADDEKQSLVVLKDDLLFVTDANFKRADEITAFLRKVIGTLPIVPAEPLSSPSTIMESIVKLDSDMLTLGSKATLLTPEERKVSISKGSLYNSEAQTLVDDGAIVQQLEMVYDSVVTFTLSEDFSIKGLKFASDLGLDDIEGETGKFLVEFAEVEKLFKMLLEE